MTPPDDFEAELQRVYADLLARQTSLPADIARLWDENADALYESGEARQ